MNLTKKELESLLNEIVQLLRRHAINDCEFGEDSSLTGITIQVLSDEPDYQFLIDLIYPKEQAMKIRKQDEEWFNLHKKEIARKEPICLKQLPNIKR